MNKPDSNPEELDHRASIILKDYSGIFAAYEAFYIESIVYASSRAIDAFLRYDIARSVGDTQVNQVSAVHEALAHAGALSHFFWPSPLGRKASQTQRQLTSARANKLREAFAVTEDSPLKNRNVRNSLEHFDERLDSYLLVNDSGYFFPSALIGQADMAEDKRGHIFKMVDPISSTFVCLGISFEFGTLRKETQRIHGLAQQMMKNGARLKPARSKADD
jgi:hypothetical protein